MFTHCMKHVYTIFKTYLHHAERNVSSMLEDTIILCLKMHSTQRLKIFFNHICKYAYTIFGALFVSCLKVFYVMYEYMSAHNFKHIYTMFEDVLIHCWHTCSHKIDDICEAIFIQICSKLCRLIKVDESEKEIVQIQNSKEPFQIS